MTTIHTLQRLIITAFFTPTGNAFTADADEAWGVPVMLVSDPGAGKSSVMRQLMSAMTYKPTLTETARRAAGFLSYEPGSVGEAGFGVTPVPVTQPSGELALVFPPSAELVAQFASGPGERRKPGLLFLDEASTARGAQLDAFLTAIQYGKIGTHQLNPRVRRIGAMNPSAQTSGGELIPIAVANRMCWLQFPDPSTHEWLDYMANGAGLARVASIDIDAQEARMLAGWNEAYAQALGSFGGWLQAQPQYLRKTPDLNSDAGSGPWPSPRSLEYAVRLYAASTIQNLSETERNTLIFGCLGESAGHAWYTWQRHADLPNVDDFLDKRVEFTHRMERLDRTHALLTACRARMTSKGLPQDQLNARADVLWTFLAHVGESAADLCRVVVRDLHSLGLAGRPSAAPALRVLGAPLAACTNT